MAHPLPPLVFDKTDTSNIFYSLEIGTDLTMTSTTSPYFASYTVTLTATTSPIAPTSFSFALRVLNPCAFADYSTITGPFDTQIVYVIGDPTATVPIPSDFTFIGPSFCGSISVTSVEADDTVFTISTDFTSMTVFSTDKALEGTTKDVLVTASLVNYPGITGTTLISVAFIPAAVPVI